MDEPPAKGFRGPKVIPAKNKTPAPIQITAEQLLREAKERQLEYVAPVSNRLPNKLRKSNIKILMNLI